MIRSMFDVVFACVAFTRSFLQAVSLRVQPRWKSTPRSRLTYLVLVLAMLSAWVPSFVPFPAHAAAPLPAGLPAYFFLGLDNQPGQVNWMVNSGVPWNARYKYLVGGVNTGNGWANWNPNGDFATYYMQDSAANGYMPVFTYYQLLQSSPGGGSEGDANYTNLNNSSTMRAYYADFKLLMDKIRAFNKPVIVHVEPDLFGFLQQRVINTTNSAASISASVASSGHSDVQGLPNTFQGFNWALLRLRDRYAPNAILAAHVSGWSSGTDIGSDSRSNLDLTSIVQKTVAFHNTAGIAGNPSGISSYNLLFFDPLDRDAAFYQYQYGDGGARWWDESNQRFPNFNRYHQYIKGVTDGTNRRALLWQVPIGNTKMRTMNNSWGHYQDNRVQYWLGNYPADGHLQALANSGVVGILFGMGASGVTSYQDTLGDGITNPPAINGNTTVAQFADDDGGYLRTVARNYYQSGVYRFGGTNPTATRTATSTRTPSPTPVRTSTPTPVRTPVRTPTPAPTGATRSIFGDALASGWQDWSWDPLTRNLAATTPVYRGSRSIAVTYTGGWSGFQLGRTSPLNLTGYDVLRFWIHGGTSGGQQISVRVANSSGEVKRTITVQPNTWQQVEVPLSTLSRAEATVVWWQNATGGAQPTFYLDEVAFIDKN
jgi:hypothetical protein